MGSFAIPLIVRSMMEADFTTPLLKTTKNLGGVQTKSGLRETKR